MQSKTINEENREEIKNAIENSRVVFGFVSVNYVELLKSIFEYEILREICSEKSLDDSIFSISFSKMFRNLFNYLESSHSLGESIQKISEKWNSEDDVLPKIDSLEKTKDKHNFMIEIVTGDAVRNLLHHNNVKSEFLLSNVALSKNKNGGIQYANVLINYEEILKHKDFLCKVPKAYKEETFKKIKEFFLFIENNEQKQPYTLRGKECFFVQKNVKNRVFLKDFIDVHFKALQDLQEETVRFL